VRKTPAWTILVAAVCVGVAGDLLLRGGQWRAGFAIWIAFIAACAMFLGENTPRTRILMLLGTAAAAVGLVRRDADLLYAIDMLSVLCMGALTIWHGSGMRFSELTVIESARAGVLALLNTAGGAAQVIRQDRAERGQGDRASGRVRALLIGSVLAVPPFVVVAMLLAKSDAIFDGLIHSVSTTIAVDGLQHAVIVCVLTWITAGWIRAATGGAVGSSVANITSPRLHFVSIAVGLYALVALLSLFLIVQARVVFGGAAFLRETAGLTVATYARDGFFQLITAAGVVIGTLVMAEWLMERDDAVGRARYRALAAVLLALVATLLVSAAVRIWLYVDLFGLSVDRGFASAMIVLVFVVLGIFGWAVWRNDISRIMPAVVVATVVWVASLNLLNPEAIVVRANVARATHGNTFDAKYHANLSADALPALLSGASQLSASDCLSLSVELRTVWSERMATLARHTDDWRSMNLPLNRAAAWHAAGAAVPCAVASRTAATSAGTRTAERMLRARAR
jgi:Domain of unknown function (DUF4173)